MEIHVPRSFDPYFWKPQPEIDVLLENLFSRTDAGPKQLVLPNFDNYEPVVRWLQRLITRRKQRGIRIACSDTLLHSLRQWWKVHCKVRRPYVLNLDVLAMANGSMVEVHDANHHPADVTIDDHTHRDMLVITCDRGAHKAHGQTKVKPLVEAHLIPDLAAIVVSFL